MVGDILQPTHLLLILVVALLVLGPKRLPEVGRALGNGLRDFRSAISGVVDDEPEPVQLKPATAAPVPASTATASAEAPAQPAVPDTASQQAPPPNGQHQDGAPAGGAPAQPAHSSTSSSFEPVEPA